MTRRDAIVAITALTAVPWSAFGAVGPVGYMDFHRWWAEGYNERRACVLLDGVDITYGCRWFDDTTGEAECIQWCPDGWGQPGSALCDRHGRLLTEIKHGRIEVVIP